MPRAIVNQIPQPNDNFLVDDALLERIWDEVTTELRVEDDIDVLTWIVPERVAEQGGIIRRQPEQAAFMVMSPDPNGKDKLIRTFGMTPLRDYKQALSEHGHYASRPHPAKTILAHLLIGHAKAIGALTGLTSVDEAVYMKSLNAARWVAEKAQGNRYIAGETMQ